MEVWFFMIRFTSDSTGSFPKRYLYTFFPRFVSLYTQKLGVPGMEHLIASTRFPGQPSLADLSCLISPVSPFVMRLLIGSSGYFFSASVFISEAEAAPVSPMIRIVIFCISLSLTDADSVSSVVFSTTFFTTFFVASFVLGEFFTGGPCFTGTLTSCVFSNEYAAAYTASEKSSDSSSTISILAPESSISILSILGFFMEDTTVSISSSSSFPALSLSFSSDMILSL